MAQEQPGSRLSRLMAERLATNAATATEATGEEIDEATFPGKIDWSQEEPPPTTPELEPGSKLKALQAALQAQRQTQENADGLPTLFGKAIASNLSGQVRGTAASAAQFVGNRLTPSAELDTNETRRLNELIAKPPPIMGGPNAAMSAAKPGMFSRIGDMFGGYGEDLSERNKAFQQAMAPPEELRKSIVDNPELLADPRWWANTLGNVTGSAVGFAVPAAGTAGVTARTAKFLTNYMWVAPLTASEAAIAGVAGSTLFEATVEGASTYQALLDEGKSHDEAARGAAAAVAANTALIAATNAVGLGSVRAASGPRRVGQMLTASGMEGGQEVGQEVIAAAVEGRPSEGKAEAAIQGFIGGPIQRVAVDTVTRAGSLMMNRQTGNTYIQEEDGPAVDPDVDIEIEAAPFVPNPLLESVETALDALVEADPESQLYAQTAAATSDPAEMARIIRESDARREALLSQAEKLVKEEAREKKNSDAKEEANRDKTPEEIQVEADNAAEVALEVAWKEAGQAQRKAILTLENEVAQAMGTNVEAKKLSQAIRRALRGPTASQIKGKNRRERRASYTALQDAAIERINVRLQELGLTYNKRFSLNSFAEIQESAGYSAMPKSVRDKEEAAQEAVITKKPPAKKIRYDYRLVGRTNAQGDPLNDIVSATSKKQVLDGANKTAAFLNDRDGTTEWEVTARYHPSEMRKPVKERRLIGWKVTDEKDRKRIAANNGRYMAGKKPGPTVVVRADQPVDVLKERVTFDPKSDVSTAPAASTPGSEMPSKEHISQQRGLARKATPDTLNAVLDEFSEGHPYHTIAKNEFIRRNKEKPKVTATARPKLRPDSIEPPRTQWTAALNKLSDKQLRRVIRDSRTVARVAEAKRILAVRLAAKPATTGAGSAIKAEQAAGRRQRERPGAYAQGDAEDDQYLQQQQAAASREAPNLHPFDDAPPPTDTDLQGIADSIGTPTPEQLIDLDNFLASVKEAGFDDLHVNEKMPKGTTEEDWLPLPIGSRWVIDKFITELPRGVDVWVQPGQHIKNGKTRNSGKPWTVHVPSELSTADYQAVKDLVASWGRNMPRENIPPSEQLSRQEASRAMRAPLGGQERVGLNSPTSEPVDTHLPPESYEQPESAQGDPNANIIQATSKEPEATPEERAHREAQLTATAKNHTNEVLSRIVDTSSDAQLVAVALNVLESRPGSGYVASTPDGVTVAPLVVTPVAEQYVKVEVPKGSDDDYSAQNIIDASKWASGARGIQEVQTALIDWAEQHARNKDWTFLREHADSANDPRIRAAAATVLATHKKGLFGDKKTDRANLAVRVKDETGAMSMGMLMPWIKTPDKVDGLTDPRLKVTINAYNQSLLHKPPITDRLKKFKDEFWDKESAVRAAVKEEIKNRTIIGKVWTSANNPLEWTRKVKGNIGMALTTSDWSRMQRVWEDMVDNGLDTPFLQYLTLSTNNRIEATATQHFDNALKDKVIAQLNLRRAEDMRDLKGQPLTPAKLKPFQDALDKKIRRHNKATAQVKRVVSGKALLAEHTMGESTRQLQRLKDELGADHWTKVKTATDTFRDLFDDLLTESVTSGLVGEEMAEEFRARGEYVAPMLRVAQRVARIQDVRIRAASRQGLIGVREATILKELEALSDPKIEHPVIGAMLRIAKSHRENWTNNLVRIYKNEFGRMEKYAGQVRKVNAWEKVEDTVAKVPLYENGRLEWWTLPREFAEVAMNPGRMDMEIMRIGPLTKLQHMKSLLTSSVTTFRPAFFLGTNRSRDFSVTRFNLPEIYDYHNPIDVLKSEKEYLSAVKKMIKDPYGHSSEEIREFWASGAGMTGYQTNLPGVPLGRRYMNAITDERSLLKETTGPIFQGARSLASAMETATKFMAFKRLREIGYTADAAASLARQYAGTPDITIGGELRIWADTMFMFFTPAVRGIEQTYQSIQRQQAMPRSIGPKRFYHAKGWRTEPTDAMKEGSVDAYKEFKEGKTLLSLWAKKAGGSRLRRMLTGVTLATLAYNAWNHQPDLIDEDGEPYINRYPSYIRNTMYIWQIPGLMVMTDMGPAPMSIKIAKPHSMILIQGPIDKMVNKHVYGEKSPYVSFGNAFMDVAEGISPIQVGNFDQGGGLFQNVVGGVTSTMNPGVAAPIEMSRNVQNLTGGPIAPRKTEGAFSEDIFKENDPQLINDVVGGFNRVAREAIGRDIGIPAVYVAYLLERATGSWYEMGRELEENAKAASFLGGEETPQHRDFNMAQTLARRSPFGVGGLFRNLLGPQARPDARLDGLRKQFYADEEKAERYHKSALLRLERAGEDEVAREAVFVDYDNAPPMQRYEAWQFFNRMQSDLSIIRAERGDLFVSLTETRGKSKRLAIQTKIAALNKEELVLFRDYMKDKQTLTAEPDVTLLRN